MRMFHFKLIFPNGFMNRDSKSRMKSKEKYTHVKSKKGPKLHTQK